MIQQKKDNDNDDSIYDERVIYKEFKVGGSCELWKKKHNANGISSLLLR